MRCKSIGRENGWWHRRDAGIPRRGRGQKVMRPCGLRGCEPRGFKRSRYSLRSGLVSAVQKDWANRRKGHRSDGRIPRRGRRLEGDAREAGGCMWGPREGKLSRRYSLRSGLVSAVPMAWASKRKVAPQRRENKTQRNRLQSDAVGVSRGVSS